VAWTERGPLLRGAADVWIISDQLTPADAAVILGGGLNDRPFAAADLYHEGLVKKILISNVADDRAAEIMAFLPHTETNRQILLRLGVPPDVIETFGIENRNTYDEAVAVRRWIEQHGKSIIIIPTEIFSARRVRWIFNRELASPSVRIEVLSMDPPQYTRKNWWTNEAGLIAFQNEIVKYVYYRLKY
jgi:uncharacterized SAM-binding protein YcdF (DUF218 family)